MSAYRTLAFSAPPGGTMVPEKGPERSAAQLAHLASWVDPQGDVRLKLRTGATRNLRFHDGSAVSSAKADKAMDMLASLVGVTTEEVRTGLTFGGHEPTAALVKTALVAAFVLCDTEQLPESPPEAILDAPLAATGPPSGSGPPAGSNPAAAGAPAAQLADLTATRDNLSALGIPIPEELQQKITDLETASSSPAVDIEVYRQARDGLVALGLTVPPDLEARLQDDPAVSPGTPAPPLASAGPAPPPDDLWMTQPPQSVWPPASNGAWPPQPPTGSRAEALVAARAALEGATAQADHFRRTGAPIPANVLEQCARAQAAFAAARAGPLAPGGAHPDFQAMLSSDGTMSLSSVSRVAAKFSPATIAKLVKGKFVEFSDMYKEIKGLAHQRKSTVKLGTLELEAADPVPTAEGFKPLTRSEHALVMSAWLSLLREHHASNPLVLDDLGRFEARVLSYADRYPTGVAYQRFVRETRLLLNHAATVREQYGQPDVPVLIGEPSTDLLLECFGDESPGKRSRGNGGTAASGDKIDKPCFQWNKKGSCQYKHCVFKHACSACGSTSHPRKDCPDVSGKNKKQKTD
eukprot:m.92626 g.92626  ORF g.92626 m.92626 type:complete len:579 (+) comp9966_c0_seq1:1642-3378(+)